MKNRNFLTLLVVFCLVITSLFACASDGVANKPISSGDLSGNLDNDAGGTSEPSNADSDTNVNEKEEAKKDKFNVAVFVTDKTNIPEDIYNGIYSDRVEFSFSIENNESKDIKGIKGVLNIKDLFGKQIMSLNCDFTGKKIAKGTSTNFSDIGIDINEFMSNHTKLYNEKYDDLNFEYEIQKVVYQDQDTTTKTTYDEVVIQVIDKYNLSEDIYNGRYSPEVLFDFDIFNNSDKAIKGIQGVLVVNDLFDDQIIRINCDFTGKMIESQNSAIYGGMSIEVNEFMDAHVSLYNEDYADLNFEYIIETIVYADGTIVEK